jgi:hypothetical protein
MLFLGSVRKKWPTFQDEFQTQNAGSSWCQNQNVKNESNFCFEKVLPADSVLKIILSQFLRGLTAELSKVSKTLFSLGVREKKKRMKNITSCLLPTQTYSKMPVLYSLLAECILILFLECYHIFQQWWREQWNLYYLSSNKPSLLTLISVILYHINSLDFPLLPHWPWTCLCYLFWPLEE